MTPKERARPELLNAKRKIRIAKGCRDAGAGRQQALKMHQEMERTMKQIRKMGGLKAWLPLFGSGGPDGLGGDGAVVPGGLPGLWWRSMGGGMGSLPGLAPAAWGAAPIFRVS